MHIQLDHRTRKITRQNIATRIPLAITQLPGRTIRTREAQRSRTTPNDIEAQVLAWFHLFIRAGIDELVDHGVARTVIPETVAVRFVERAGNIAVEGQRAVGKCGVDVAGLQPVVVCGEIFAAGDDYGAEPVFVVSFAVFAGPG